MGVPLSYMCMFICEAYDSIRDSKLTGLWSCFFFFQAEDGIRDYKVTGVQTCALPISSCACQLHDPRHDGVRALLGDGRLGHQPEQLGAILGHRSRDDVGSADVNPDDVAHRSPRLLEGRLVPRATSCTGDAPAGSGACPAARARRTVRPAARTRSSARWTRK